MTCFYHVFRELNRLCFHTQALDCMACTASRINGYFRRSPAQITHAPPDLLIGNHLLGMWLLCIPCIWPFETCIRWLQLGQVFLLLRSMLAILQCVMFSPSPLDEAFAPSSPCGRWTLMSRNWSVYHFTIVVDQDIHSADCGLHRPSWKELQSTSGTSCR